MSIVTEKMCVQSNDQKPNSRLRGSPHPSWSPMTITSGDRDFFIEAHRKYIKMRRRARASLRSQAQVMGLAPSMRGEQWGRGRAWGGGSRGLLTLSLLPLLSSYLVSMWMENFGRKEHYGKRERFHQHTSFFSLHIFSLASGCAPGLLVVTTVHNQRC